MDTETSGENHVEPAQSFSPIEHGEVQTHSELDSIAEEAKKELIMLRLEAQVQDALDAKDRDERIASIHDQMHQLQADVDLIGLVSSHHSGYGDVTGIHISKDTINDLMERLPRLGKLSMGYDTHYVHERFLGDLEFNPEDGKPGFTEEFDKSRFKSADDVASMSDSLRSKYTEVHLLNRVSTPVANTEPTPFTESSEPVQNQIKKAA